VCPTTKTIIYGILNTISLNDYHAKSGRKEEDQDEREKLV
jgi:hypothetical protein